jgi:hypothetical protein
LHDSDRSQVEMGIVMVVDLFPSPSLFAMLHSCQKISSK